MKNKTYFILIFFIGLISAYDNLLTLKFADIIIETEENPVGLLIIKKYGVYVFMAIKAVGTICAVILSFLLLKTKYKRAIWAVFILQLLLFFYLTFYVPDGLFKRDFLFFLRKPPEYLDISR
jgi:hypothetical protein